MRFAALLLFAACSRGFESDRLGLVWSPPSGIHLLSEEAGPPPRAAFEEGITWYRLDGAAVSLDERELPATLQAVAEAGRVPLDGTLTSARTGTLPVGEVVRYELRGEGTRTLAYLIPRTGAAVLLVARAPDARYGLISASVERSLSTLRWR